MDPHNPNDCVGQIQTTCIEPLRATCRRIGVEATHVQNGQLIQRADSINSVSNKFLDFQRTKESVASFQPFEKVGPPNRGFAHARFHPEQLHLRRVNFRNKFGTN